MSCQTCTVSSLCEACKLVKHAISAEKVEQAWAEFEEKEDEENSEAGEVELAENLDSEADEDSDELDDNASESEDDQASSSGEEDEEESDEDSTEVSMTDPGSIVWECWGSRWYPAKVVLLAEVPEAIRNSLRRDTGRSAVVKFYGDDDYGRVDIKKIDQLGVSNLDLKRSRFPGVMLKYNMALADLKYRL